MRLRKPLLLLLILAVIAASALLAYRYTHSPQRDNLAVLEYLPHDPDAVVYVDLAALRQSPFLTQFAAWAPQPQRDPDYAQFVADTGFNFERDLDHIAIAKRPANSSGTFFIAEGKFDRQKIAAYALRSGTKHIVNGHEAFFVPLDANAAMRSRPAQGASVPAAPPDSGKSSLAFAFVSDRILIAGNNATQLPAEMFSAAHEKSGRDEWHERFVRLAGSPVFAVIRQDAAASLASRAPGGFRSDQLSSLLAQLQWITIAAKPDADQLHLVAEGESTSDATSRQLADVLNGVLILAEAGLNDPKLRQQLAPDVRQACLDLLKSADISKLDRGDTKSVRVVLSLTPQFLEAARRYSTAAPPPSAGASGNGVTQPTARKAQSRKSGT
jgi:hypothetical protein